MNTFSKPTKTVKIPNKVLAHEAIESAEATGIATVGHVQQDHELELVRVAVVVHLHFGFFGSVLVHLNRYGVSVGRHLRHLRLHIQHCDHAVQGEVVGGEDHHIAGSGVVVPHRHHIVHHLRDHGTSAHLLHQLSLVV